MRTPGTFLLCVIAAGCSASSPEFQRANELAREEEWAAAVEYYERAVQDHPENIEYRIALQRATLEARQHHARQARIRREAGDIAGAIEELERALAYGATNTYLADLLRELTEELEAPEEAPPQRPEPPETTLHLKFAEGTSLRKIFETLGELGGFNVLFDESFRDRPVEVELEGVTFREALDLLTQTQGLFYKVVSPSSVSVTTEEPRSR